MAGHVVLFTAGDSGLCLVQRVQTGYRTLSCDQHSCLFIGYSVSFHAKKIVATWSSPYPSFPLRKQGKCVVSLSYPFDVMTCTCITSVLFISHSISHATFCKCSGILFVTKGCSQFALISFLSFTTHSQYTLIPYLSLYQTQPVYTDTLLVPLPKTASLH